MERAVRTIRMVLHRTELPVVAMAGKPGPAWPIGVALRSEVPEVIPDQVLALTVDEALQLADELIEAARACVEEV